MRKKKSLSVGCPSLQISTRFMEAIKSFKTVEEVDGQLGWADLAKHTVVVTTYN